MTTRQLFGWWGVRFKVTTHSLSFYWESNLIHLSFNLKRRNIKIWYAMHVRGIKHSLKWKIRVACFIYIIRLWSLRKQRGILMQLLDQIKLYIQWVKYALIKIWMTKFKKKNSYCFSVYLLFLFISGTKKNQLYIYIYKQRKYI